MCINEDNSGPTNIKRDNYLFGTGVVILCDLTHSSSWYCEKNYRYTLLSLIISFVIMIIIINAKRYVH